MLQDLRLAFRTLGVNPGFAIAGLATLALGIGITTAMFSITYGVLLRPLPYGESDRIVRVAERHPGAADAIGEPRLSNLTYHAWNGQSRTIGPIATYGEGFCTVGLDEPTRMPHAAVSTAFFDVLRVSPALGRFFTADDAREGGPRVVVLSHRLWRERFAASASAIGQILRINQNPHEIVGVAPVGFEFPSREAMLWTASAALPHPSALRDRVRVSDAIARLRPGVSPAQAAAEGTAAARSQPRPPSANFIYGNGGPVEVEVEPIAEAMTVRVRPVLILFFAAAGCLLLLACANVANLMLSRGASRERELAIRAALGASRGRVIRLLLTESGLLALLGGALGVALALAVVRVLPTVAPADFPRLADVRVDWAALGFACAVSLIAGLLCGTAPALKGGRRDVLSGLRGGAGAGSGRETARTRRTILVAEASLAMMLLVVAALMARSFVRLTSVDAGYDADRVLTARVFLPGASLRPGEADVFASALLGRLRALPNVEAAGAGWMAPFAQSTSSTTMTIPVPGRQPVSARSLVNVVTPGYAEALRLRLRAGRLLTDSDRSASRQHVVVNEEFVRTFLAGTEPIGFNLGVILSRGVEAEVIGVVANVLKDALQDDPLPEVYLVAAHRYSVGGEIKLVVRTEGDPLASSGVVRQLVRDLRTDAAVDRVAPLATHLADSVRTERLTAATLGTFAVLALFLAAIGLYGVLSYAVSARHREFGIRTALGATRRDIAQLIVGQGMRLATAGLVLGLAAAAVVARSIQSLLYGIQPFDAVAFVAAPIALAAVALTACLVPARRAAAIDPAVALRSE